MNVLEQEFKVKWVCSKQYIQEQYNMEKKQAVIKKTKVLNRK